MKTNFKSIILLGCFMLVFLTVSVFSAPIPESWSHHYTAAELGITEFDEAPMLKEMVENGELPPLEDRLPVPEATMVIEPAEQVGVYGGKATNYDLNPNSYAAGSHPRLPFLFFTDQSASAVVPDVAKDYELRNNNTELIIYLREGMKWSDGYPFTVDDILFWWEDQAN